MCCLVIGPDTPPLAFWVAVVLYATISSYAVVIAEVAPTESTIPFLIDAVR